jgi:hypothetical protein
MLTFLFDFGSLLTSDEEKYIIKMIEKENSISKLFTQPECLTISKLVYMA